MNLLKGFLSLLLCCVISSPTAYYQLYIWRCGNCNCKYYGRNPPLDSRCLKTGLFDVWILEQIKKVPLTKEQLKEFG